MSAPAWSELEALFHEVLTRPAAERAALLAERCAGRPELRAQVDAMLRAHPSDRSSFVAAACGDDETLRREVEALLAHARSADDFLASSRSVNAVNRLGDGPETSLVGQQLGAYRLLAFVGAGGMGEVYRARDERLDREVAVKVLKAAGSPDPDRHRRFRREAHAIASLNHPHICTVHDVGQQGGLDYLVMEYLDGDTLKDRLFRTAPLPIEDALRIAREVAEALAESHRHGIVHRDVKPGNIKLTRSGAKLLDFGVARMVATRDRPSPGDPTVPEIIVGTPAYMSPEQVRGQEVDARSDLFSLGAVLYEMTTGQPPFPGGHLIEIIEAVLHHEPDAVSTLNPAVPPGLARLIHTCLAKEPAQRYESAYDVWVDLTNCGADSSERAWTSFRPRRRHNLPLQLTSFVGRDQEVVELATTLETTRLVTLSGSGGCGKTRLALEVASTVIDRYGAGVWLVELADVSNPDLVPLRIAAALGVQEEEGRPGVERLVEYLESKQVLIVLDNCEHLIATTARVAETILKGCQHVRILATSREPLHVPGEQVWRVPSLKCPATAAEDVSQLTQYEAVRLFVERARCLSALQLDHTSASYVVEICRRLDGIPLAIEMAAARLDVLSLDQIAQRLHDRFALLVGSPRAPLPRQETLRATIDWSYELLSPVEQMLFGRLAVFVGGFTLEAVEHVCISKDLRPMQILENLSRLVDKSMVTVTRTNLGVRYHVLETLRAYALDKLQRLPEPRRTYKSHAEYFVALAEQLEVDFESSRTAVADDHAEQEHQNVLAALDWCTAARRRSELGLRIASAFRPFWDVRCYLQLAKQSLLRALERDNPPTRKPIRLKALDAAGYFLFRLEDFDACGHVYEDMLQLAQELGERDQIATALYWLGAIARWQDRHSHAEMLQRRALETTREGGSKAQMATALDGLASVVFDRGDHALAQSHWQESLELFRQLHMKSGMTRALFGLGMLATVRADNELAESVYLEALALARETRHRGNIAFSTIRLGDVYASCDHQRSRRLYNQALAIGEDVGYKRLIAIALARLADLSCEEGEYGESTRLVEQSCALLRELGAGRSLLAAECQLRLSQVSYEQGHFARALRFCQAVMDWGAFEGSKSLRENTLRQLGWIRLAADDCLGARGAFEESLEVAQQSGSLVGLIGLHLGRGYCDLIEGVADTAQSHFEAALALSEERTDKRLCVESLLALGETSLFHNQIEKARDSSLRALRLARELGLRKGLSRALCRIGTVVSRQGQHELAIRCFAASSALLYHMNGAVPSFQLGGYDQALARVRSEIAPDRFQRLWSEGMTTIDYADQVLQRYAES